MKITLGLTRDTCSVFRLVWIWHTRAGYLSRGLSLYHTYSTLNLMQTCSENKRLKFLSQPRTESCRPRVLSIIRFLSMLRKRYVRCARLDLFCAPKLSSSVASVRTFEYLIYSFPVPTRTYVFCSTLSRVGAKRVYSNCHKRIIRQF